MLDWSLAAAGVGIGIAVAAPIGPVNIMCIHRSVRRGFWSGLSAGLGSMIADGMFAAAAAFGISAISTFVSGHVGAMKLIGGSVLVAFGLYVVLRRPRPDRGLENDTTLSLVGAGVSSFVLAITNPALLLGFMAIFGGLGKFEQGPLDFGDAVILVVGVMAGSLLWSSALCGLVSHLRHRMTDRLLRGLNIASGAALAAFGVGVLTDAALGPFVV